MKLFDSHCHLEDDRFQEDRPQVMERMRAAGVNKCILAGSDLPSCEKILKLVGENPGFVYGVVGVHPHEASGWEEETEEKLEKWQSLPGILGIGEIGLDYYYDLSPREKQKEVLLRQLDLACRLQVPVVFHIRDAHGDMLDLLRSRHGNLPAGVVHCFSGSVETARDYLNMGFFLSFGGPLTFKNAARLPEVAAYCPGDRFLLETDSPYLSPVPMRGRRNEPAYVAYVAEKMGEIRGISGEEAAETAYGNTCRLYGLGESRKG